MSSVHVKIINHIKKNIDVIKNNNTKNKLLSMDEHKLIKTLFFNSRNFVNDINDAKGYRLTVLGVHVLQVFFQSYEVEFKEKKIYTASELLYLDSYLKFPYFINKEKIVVFDKDFSVWLKLTDGDLTQLKNMTA